jgi:hypothetical protein
LQAAKDILQKKVIVSGSSDVEGLQCSALVVLDKAPNLVWQVVSITKSDLRPDGNNVVENIAPLFILALDARSIVVRRTPSGVLADEVVLGIDTLVTITSNEGER